MTDPELVTTDWSLFRADGQWHDIGHGIEVMAYLYMVAGTFYIRAKEPLPRGSEAGEQSLASQNVDPADQIQDEAGGTAEDQPLR